MSVFADKASKFPVLLLPGSGKLNRTIFVLGSTGCGKTTLIANLLLRSPQGRFVIFDTKDEYPAEFFSVLGKVVVVRGLKEFAEALNEGNPRIIYKVEGYEGAEDYLSAALLQLMEFQRANKELPITVALDELNRFAAVNVAPPGVIEIVQRGRGLNIQKIFGAQWFGTIPTWCRDSFSELYVFRHSDRAGLTLLLNYGFEWEDVTDLPQYTCLYTNGGQIKRIALTPTNQINS